MKLENRTIEFKPRAILTHEMMEEIYDFPHRVLGLKYAEYGDGIIAGLNYVTKEDKIYLTKGIVKLDNEFYFLMEDVNLTEMTETLKDNKLVKAYHFALKEREAEQEGGVNKKFLELEITEDVTGLIGLGSFFKELSLKLPDISKVEIKNLYEEFTRRSRFRLLEVPYSDRSGTTFHPYIFSGVKNALKIKKDKNFLDYMLIIEIENHGTVSLETLKIYIAESGMKLKAEPSRAELFEEFTKALQREMKIAMPHNVKLESDSYFDDDDEESPLI